MPRKPSRPRPKRLGDYSLSVKRGPDSDGRWYYRLMWWETGRSGERRRKTRSLGWLTVLEADDALKAACNAVGEEDDREPFRDTVADLLGAWLAKVDAGPLRPATKSHYRQCVTRLKAELGEILVERLGYEDLERYVNGKIVSKGESPRTVIQDLRICRNAWNWARKAGYVADRRMELPTVKVTPGDYRVNHRTPTDAEVAATVDAMTSTWKRDAVRLTWATGSRIGAVLGLTWEQVELDTSTISLRTKTGIKVLPLGSPAVAVLQERHEAQGKPDEGRVFPEVGDVDTAISNVRSSVLRGCKRAAIKPWTPHALRRLAVDSMARAGIDVATAASITGHSPEVMLRHYRTVSKADQRRALAKAGLGEVAAAPKGQVIGFPKK